MVNVKQSGGRCNKATFKYIGFYNKFHSGFDPRMVSDNIYFNYIDPFFNNRKAAEALDDKNLYDSLFFDARQPATIFRKQSGVLFDKNFKKIDLKEAYRLCRLYAKVIIKPSISSMGGHGIEIWKCDDDYTSFETLINAHWNIVVQEVVQQHDELSSLHKNSINTVRIITLLRNGDAIPLSAIVRMGIDGNMVDNASSGGIFCGIEENGQLKSVAYNTSGKKFLKHPQGAEFSSHCIPNFEECIEIVKRLAPRLYNVSKLVSWDLAIGMDGHPILIEANLYVGELDFHQIANGPLFGDMTEEIINEVFAKKKYKRFKRFF